VTTYYGIDMSRITWAEAWRFGKLGGLLYLVNAKLEPRRVVGDTALARTEAHDFVRDVDLSEHARQALREMEASLGESFHRVGLAKGQTRARHPGFVAMGLASDGLVVSQCIHVGCGGQEVSVIGLASELEDGLRISTGNSGRKLETAPGSIVTYLPGASGDRLLRAHRAKLDELARRSRPKRFDDAAALDSVVKGEQRSHDFHVARGVYVPLTPGEIERLQVAGILPK
jgi:hypothetical protein